MKQLLPLFLLLVPCLAWAQYPSNGNQKITLGEQTTADGLIFRGVLGDTALITPLSDTSAYIILDTVNHRFYNYNRATNVWSVAGGGSSVTTFSGGTTGLTPSTATSGAVTLGGTLGGANGGTGLTTFGAVGRIPYASSTTLLTTSSNLLYDGSRLRVNQIAIGDTASSTSGLINLLSLSGEGAGFTLKSTYYAPTLRSFSFLINAVGNAGFWNNNTSSYSYFIENATNNIGIGTVTPDQKLHVVGNARITAMNGIGDIGADANGVLQAATSDMNLKNTIENSPFGLNEILLLNPVTFLYNDTNRKIDSDVKEVGFIAQDVFDIIPNAVSSTGNGDLQLDYRAITATLTKAIQEQQALIKALEQRIINLENK
jgi:hypothetical protein